MAKNNNKQFREDLAYRISRLEHLGKKHGWTLYKKDTTTMEFISPSPPAEMYVDYINLTIKTKLLHPKQGESLLVRSGVLTEKLVETIFRNPRAHMPNGVNSTHLGC